MKLSRVQFDLLVEGIRAIVAEGKLTLEDGEELEFEAYDLLGDDDEILALLDASWTERDAS